MTMSSGRVAGRRLSGYSGPLPVARSCSRGCYFGRTADLPSAVWLFSAVVCRSGLAGCGGGGGLLGRASRPGAGRCGLQGRFDVVPGHARWQQDCDDVSCAVPGLELLADLIAGSAGGELVEHDLGAGRDGPASWAGARVRGDDRLDLGGVALAGEGPGVDLAHGAQVPGGAAGGDAPGRVGVFVDGGDGPGRDCEGPGVWCGGLGVGGGAGPPRRGGGRGLPARGSSRHRVRRPPGWCDGPARRPRWAGRGRAAGPPQRVGGRGVAELGGLAGQKRADLGHDVAQLGGWVPERECRGTPPPGLWCWRPGPARTACRRPGGGWRRSSPALPGCAPRPTGRRRRGGSGRCAARSRSVPGPGPVPSPRAARRSHTPARRRARRRGR